MGASQPDTRRVDLGPVDSFPVGAFEVFRIDHREIGVVKLADGTLHAIRNNCPHAGAPLCRGLIDGTMAPSKPGELVYSERTVVRCPWHAWEFDLATGVGLFASSELRVRVYEVACEDGRVYVEIS